MTPPRGEESDFTPLPTVSAPDINVPISYIMSTKPRRCHLTNQHLPSPHVLSRYIWRSYQESADEGAVT